MFIHDVESLYRRDDVVCFKVATHEGTIKGVVRSKGQFNRYQDFEVKVYSVEAGAPFRLGEVIFLLFAPISGRGTVCSRTNYKAMNARLEQIEAKVSQKRAGNLCLP